MFTPGQIVKVCEGEGDRLPNYCRGKTGTIEVVLDPAVSKAAPGSCIKRRLYRLRFLLSDLWSDYAGSPADSVHVVIANEFLEAAGGSVDTK